MNKPAGLKLGHIYFEGDHCLLSCGPSFSQDVTCGVKPCPTRLSGHIWCRLTYNPKPCVFLIFFPIARCEGEICQEILCGRCLELHLSAAQQGGRHALCRSQGSSVCPQPLRYQQGQAAEKRKWQEIKTIQIKLFSFRTYWLNASLPTRL